MKSFAWIPAACLAGMIIGAWGPRDELRALKERKQDVERPQRARNAADGFQAFAKMASIPAEANRKPRRRPSDKALFAPATNRAPAQAAKPAAEDAKDKAASKPAATNDGPRKAERMTPEDLRARIEEAQELWRTRVELARAKWKDKLGLDAAAAERFEAALDGMNEQLYDTMQAMATLLSQQDKMTPELGLRMMGDATTIMAETYEKLGACVPAERRAEVSEIQVFDFIDPGVAEPLIAVQDKLERFQVPNGGESRK